jgi:hypothetical protein
VFFKTSKCLPACLRWFPFCFCLSLYLCLFNTPASLFLACRLADWFASFAMRHYASPLAEAGLVVGGITVVAGVGGNALGAMAAAELEPRWRSAFFAVPALFTVPGALFLVLAINGRSAAEGGSRWAAYAWVFASECCLWTMLAPVAALVINVTAPELRARAMALSILTQHVLGDMISPPIIGAVSDARGLKAGLQLTWVAVLVSGICWGVGARCLAPLPVSKQREEDARRRSEQGGGRDRSSIYYSILFGEDERKNDAELQQENVDSTDTAERSEEQEFTLNPMASPDENFDLEMVPSALCISGANEQGAVGLV